MCYSEERGMIRKCVLEKVFLMTNITLKSLENTAFMKLESMFSVFLNEYTVFNRVLHLTVTLTAVSASKIALPSNRFLYCVYFVVLFLAKTSNSGLLILNTTV